MGQHANDPFAPHMEAIARKVLGPPVSFKNGEMRYGSQGSLSIDVRRGVFKSFEDDELRGGVLDLIVAFEDGIRDHDDAARWMREEGYTLPDRPDWNPTAPRQNGKQALAKPKAAAKPKPKPASAEKAEKAEIIGTEGEWFYTDEEREVLYRVRRYLLSNGKKTYAQNRYDKQLARFVPGKDAMQGVRLVPYALHDLIEAVAGGVLVYVCEGEKVAERLRAAGFVATTNVGGATKWGGDSDEGRAMAEAMNPHFKGARVVILPDNDEPGRKHAKLVAAELRQVCESVHVLALPGLPHKKDAYDWFEELGHTADELRELAAKAEKADDYLARTEKADEAEKPRFPIINLDDIELRDDPVWLIDGLLPASGLAVVFGPPKSLKTFLVTDALFNVALGRRWAGRETKQGAVVYITGEGVRGFERRLIATRRHYGVEGKGVPFGMIPAAPNFGTASGDADELVKLVREWLASVGNPPLAAIAVDTLARTMKGADENAAKDMSVFVDNCAILADAFGCLALAVHHAGKDTSRGSRGSNSLDAAADAMWSVEKGEAASTAEIYRMKDGEEGDTWQFRLVPFILKEATDTERAVTTGVVEIVSEPGEAKQAKQVRSKKPIGTRPGLLLRTIDRALTDAGKPLKGSIIVPPDVPSIDREDLKRYLPLEGYWDKDTPSHSQRSAFSNDLRTLKMRGYIGLTADRVWRLS